MKFLSMLLLLVGAAKLVAAPLQYDVSAGYTRDDNITRAELERDIEQDSIVDLGASATLKLPLNNISYFSVGASLALNHYLEYSKLDNTRIGAQGSYYIRPTSGYTAIKYFASLGYEQRMYDSDLRESSATQFGLGLSKRITDRISMRLGYGKESIDADSDVFDADNKRLYLDTEYKLNNSNHCYLTLSKIDGDIVATTVPTTKIIQYSSAIVRDDAFLGLAPDRYAYKLSAKTTVIAIGDSMSVGAGQNIDASLTFYDASAYGGNDYSGMLLNLAYLLRF